MTPTAERKYYSHRVGTDQSRSLSLPVLLTLAGGLYTQLVNEGYYQETLGYECVDAGHVAGSLGSDAALVMARRLRKTNLWPPEDRFTAYGEEDLFDVVEFLFDLVSAPIRGNYHSWRCGWHYDEFDRPVGQLRFREELNPLLADYGDGFELTGAGEIRRLAPAGLDRLMRQPLPRKNFPDAAERVEAAISKYARHGATGEARRDAVRDLADVLERIRPELKKVISNADENDLFQLANNYSIRHFNERQKDQYDSDVFLPWIFYTYLNMVHLALRLVARAKASKQGP